jgi:hypothetical protein
LYDVETSIILYNGASYNFGSSMIDYFSSFIAYDSILMTSHYVYALSLNTIQ